MSGLLGQGAPEAEPVQQPVPDAAGLAEGMEISPSAAQAALALVMGSLLRGGGAEGTEGGSLAGRLAQLGDRPLDEEAVKATGLPEQLSRSTGLDLPKAVQTVQQILEMLRKVTKPLGSAGTTARKKRKKTSSSTRPKAKPKKTTSSTRPKAKPKKPSTSRPKAKPKKTSTSSTTKRRKTTSKRKPAK